MQTIPKNNIKEITKIGIIGAGAMGLGIASVFASYGFKVFLFDNNLKSLGEAHENIKQSLIYIANRDQTNKNNKANIIKNTERIISRIFTLISLKEMKEMDLIIEAVSEQKKIKKEVYSELKKIGYRNYLATNTSSFLIKQLASATNCAENFIGLHFMNPAYLTKLIEIIPSSKTSKTTLEIIKNLVTIIDREYVLAKDTPGFVVNRLLLPMINDAAYCLENEISSIDDIDKALLLGANMPMGPLKLADFIGLDICYNILTELNKTLKREVRKPCPIFLRYIKHGYLGRKSKMGFYNYNHKPAIANYLNN